MRSLELWALRNLRYCRGCDIDMVSFFAGHGERTAWAVWTALPELTQTLTLLFTAPDHIDEHAMHTVERFIILPYDRTRHVATTQTVCKEKQCDTTDGVCALAA